MPKEAKYGKITGVILSAGIGERMRPLSLIRPKPLFPVMGKPLFEITVSKLLESGASSIHSNTFHLGERIERFAAGKDWPVSFHRESKLLGTGGGIGNMAPFLSSFDTILLHNADIISGLDYEPALAHHREHGALITLILAGGGNGMIAPPGGECSGAGPPPRLPPPSVRIEGDGEVMEILGKQDRPARGGGDILGYTGMAVISPQALDFFPAGRTYPLVSILSELAAERPGSIRGFAAVRNGDGHVWGDAGSVRGYIDIHRRILLENADFGGSVEPPGYPVHIGEGAVVHPGASWRGFLEIGPGAVIGENTSLEDCVVIEGAAVPEGGSFRETVIFDGGTMHG